MPMIQNDAISGQRDNCLVLFLLTKWARDLEVSHDQDSTDRWYGT